MILDAHPNYIVHSFLKMSALYFELDLNYKNEITLEIPNDYRFDDRRKNSRINSGRRQIDLLNYF